MEGLSSRNWDMSTHPVLDTIPSHGITKSEWAERVEKTGRAYTDPFVFRHSSMDVTAVPMSDLDTTEHHRS